MALVFSIISQVEKNFLKKLRMVMKIKVLFVIIVMDKNDRFFTFMRVFLTMKEDVLCMILGVNIVYEIEEYFKNFKNICDNIPSFKKQFRTKSKFIN